MSCFLFCSGITLDISAPPSVAANSDLTYVTLCTKTAISKVGERQKHFRGSAVTNSSTSTRIDNEMASPCCSTCKAGAIQCSALTGSCRWSQLLYLNENTPHCAPVDSSMEIDCEETTEKKCTQRGAYCVWGVRALPCVEGGWGASEGSVQGFATQRFYNPEMECCAQQTCNWFC
jgi:hypothetical protein